MPKTILHIIETLGVGGAETLLLNTVNNLGPGFKNIIVYLHEPNVLGNQFHDAELICLNYTGKWSLPATALKLRNLIKDYKADLVHAHLFWPTIIARLACPAEVRLLFSVHSMLSEDAFKPSPKSRWLEKLTYRSKHEAIFVSETARKDYAKFVGLKGKSYVLYNFIGDIYFEEQNSVKDFLNRPVRLIALGNLKKAKNFPFLLRAFQLLKKDDFVLDIYGEGWLRKDLQLHIDSGNLANVKLKGLATDIPELLKGYDIFVLASEHEGFGLAVIEAMACGLPCFISDLPVFREITAGNAIFFDLKSEQDLINKLLWAIDHPAVLRELAEKAYKQAQKFNRENYIKELTAIYNAS